MPTNAAFFQNRETTTIFFATPLPLTLPTNLLNLTLMGGGKEEAGGPATPRLKKMREGQTNNFQTNESVRKSMQAANIKIAAAVLYYLLS